MVGCLTQVLSKLIHLEVCWSFTHFRLYFFRCVHGDSRNNIGWIALKCWAHIGNDDATSSWWRHEMETFSALLAICAGNSPVPGEFPTQRPVTRSCNVFFDLRPNKRLSEQWWGWWFATQLWSLWRHRNVINISRSCKMLSRIWISKDIRQKCSLE